MKNLIGSWGLIFMLLSCGNDSKDNPINEIIPPWNRSKTLEIVYLGNFDNSELLSLSNIENVYTDLSASVYANSILMVDNVTVDFSSSYNSSMDLAFRLKRTSFFARQNDDEERTTGCAIFAKHTLKKQEERKLSANAFIKTASITGSNSVAFTIGSFKLLQKSDLSTAMIAFRTMVPQSILLIGLIPTSDVASMKEALSAESFSYRFEKVETYSSTHSLVTLMSKSWVMRANKLKPSSVGKLIFLEFEKIK